MSITVASTQSIPDSSAAERIARASITFGRKRGYYRLLFEAGPVDAEVLRLVPSSTDGGDDGDGESELLLPGEHVPILLGDQGEAEFSGARAMLAERRDDVAPVIAAMLRT